VRMAGDQKSRCRKTQSLPAEKSIAAHKGCPCWKNLTCVPPSPGRVLYHSCSSGPVNGSWSWAWSPWAATAAAKLRTAEESFILKTVEAREKSKATVEKVANFENAGSWGK
jgi:hypothetical protein